MAEAHGHDPKGHHDSHDVPEEDLVRTPMWLPFVGLGLLLLGALSSYLWIYPGTLNPRSQAAGDGGVEGAADASAPR